MACVSVKVILFFFFFLSLSLSLPDAHSEGIILNAIQHNIPDLTCRQL